MGLPVAIFDPLPMFVRGLAATLDDGGYLTQTPDDPLTWAAGAASAVAMLSVLEAADWDLLDEIGRAAPEVQVLVLVDDVEPAVLTRAFAAGAAGVLARHADAEAMLAGLRAVEGGNAVVPLAALRRVLAGDAPPAPAAELSADEAGWLRDLAAGVTVARLADRAGYSERMMFRLLAAVYAKVGAANRTAALIAARDRGLL